MVIRKKIKQAENRVLIKRKSKESRYKLTIRVPSQRTSDQQFWIDGEHDSFATPIQRNLNLRNHFQPII